MAGIFKYEVDTGSRRDSKCFDMMFGTQFDPTATSCREQTLRCNAISPIQYRFYIFPVLNNEFASTNFSNHV